MESTITVTCDNECKKSPLYEPLADFSTTNNCKELTVYSTTYNQLFVYIDNLKSISPNIQLSDNIFIVINETDHYEIKLEFKLKVKGNSVPQLNLYDVTNKIVLVTSNFEDNTAKLVYTNIIQAGTKLGVTLTNLHCSDKIKCLKLIGTVKNSPRLTLLDEVLAFDAARKYRYIPVNPNLPNPPYGNQYPDPSPFPQAAVQFGWGYNIIPHEVNQPPFVKPIDNPYILKPTSPVPTNPALPATIDYDAYHKLNSVSAYLPYCIGFKDPIHLDPNDPRVTLFASDLEQRGVKNNRKKVYMSALTADLMPNYAKKIDVFLNEIHTSVTNYPNAALTVFKQALVRFFLEMHVGHDNYPSYVIEYFTKFTDAVGLGIPTDPNFKDSVIFCNLTIDCVSKYFFDRYNTIIQTEDKTTLLYYWNLAGLPKEAIISEALHNIIAFNQFLNVFYLMIRDQYGPGTLVPTGLPSPTFQYIKYNFVQSFCNAVTNEDQLDVIREFFRLTVPNSASFSRVEQFPADNSVVIQGRHVHQAIMFSNDPTYTTYKPSLYDNFTFDFNSAMDSECPPPTCPKCPYLVPVNPLKNVVPEVKLRQSTIDNETVIERTCPFTDPGKAIPVFANKPAGLGPVYTPFGLGYRRCAGEMFSYFVTVKLFERFKSIPFKFNPLITTPSIAVAPFTLVPDNIFFDPSGVVIC